MEELKRLDAKVSQKATVVSLILGIVGTLVMGTGMSFIMTDLGAILGLTGISGNFKTDRGVNEIAWKLSCNETSRKIRISESVK